MEEYYLRRMAEVAVATPETGDVGSLPVSCGESRGDAAASPPSVAVYVHPEALSEAVENPLSEQQRVIHSGGRLHTLGPTNAADAVQSLGLGRFPDARKTKSPSKAVYLERDVAMLKLCRTLKNKPLHND